VPAIDREQLAALWGVQTAFENYNKEPQEVSTATVDAILEALEAHAGGPPPPAATIVRLGDPVRLDGVAEIVTEDGRRIEPRDGRLPQQVEPGYHRALTRNGDETSLIVGPASCFLPGDLSAWGWALQLYSLRSEHSWGIGDLRDLREFTSWTASLGGDAVMVNPLHAPLPISGQQPSPYFPSSRCFRNPLYLAVEEIPGVERSRKIARLATEARKLNSAPTIDRDAIYRHKMKALEEAWTLGPHPKLEHGLDARDDLLWSYATFAALAEAHSGGPARWPEALAAADPRALATWSAAHEERIRFHAWLQSLIDDQLETAGEQAGVVNDLAVGVDPQGADAWLWKDVFASGVTVGAPPDEFNLRGQGWGLPPFDPWKLRAAAYEPFIQTIRSAFRHSAGIRIDHVMGLFRLYWIPDSASPQHGTYVRYPHQDLLTIVALESHRAGAYVVGEDLGTVEDSVREEMRERNIMSYRLLWFEEDKPETYPEIALAAVANHDVPTIAGLWGGRDVKAQKDAGLEVNVEGMEAQLARLREWLDLERNAPVDDVILGIYKLLADAPSAVVMATLEDVLGVEDRPNMPGTLDERPNWAIPLPVTLEELTRDPRVTSVAQMLAQGRGRAASDDQEDRRRARKAATLLRDEQDSVQ